MSFHKSYVIEIHDVYPGVEGWLGQLETLLPELILGKACLLIVPNWRGEFSLDQYPEFVTYLTNLKGTKVMHGTNHTIGPDLWNRIWFGTENHAEYARLSVELAKERLLTGRHIFERAFGCCSNWFCAPRWQLSRGTVEALPQAGFKGYMSRKKYVLFGDRIYDIPTVSFDEGRRRLKSCIAGVLRRVAIQKLLNRQQFFRLCLHPSDLEKPTTWKQCQALIATLEQEDWQVLSVEEVTS